MPKYNYFDDEYDNPPVSVKERVTASSVQDFFVLQWLWIKKFVKEGPSLSKLREYPNIRGLLKKGIFLAVFLIAVIIFISIISHSIGSAKEQNDSFCADAGKVCTKYITEYGACKFEYMDNDSKDKLVQMTGLSYVRRMDFNNDNIDELMLCYNDGGVYYLEVWGYHKKEFVKLYSSEANYAKNDNLPVSCLTFYYNNGKYNIGTSKHGNEQKVTLLALRGDEFKEKGECTYNPGTGVYSIDDEPNTADFERIQLSAIRRTRAEIIVDTVTDNIEELSAKTTVQIEAGKSNAKLKSEAYYEIIDKCNTKYGKAEFVNDGGYRYISGLAVADLIDFDGDGNDELFIIYRKELRKRNRNTYNNEYAPVSEPVYCMEVYNWNKTKAKCIFERTGVSKTLKDETDTNFYIIRAIGSAMDICNNTYSYPNRSVYTASSKIYRMKDERFETVFDARLEYEYGYITYYIDGERTYRSTFEQKGYEVPYFCNEDSYDAKTFTLTYLSGKKDKEDGLKSRIEQTAKTIKSINKDYVA